MITNVKISKPINSIIVISITTKIHLAALLVANIYLENHLYIYRNTFDIRRKIMKTKFVIDLTNINKDIILELDLYDGGIHTHNFITTIKWQNQHTL